MIFIFLGDDRAKQAFVDGLCELNNDFHVYVGLSFQGLVEAMSSILTDLSRSHTVYVQMEENFARPEKLDDRDKLADFVSLLQARNIIVHVCTVNDLSDFMSSMLA